MFKCATGRGMEDSILAIRQMMADQKFFDALNFLESQISIGLVQPIGEIALLKIELLDILDRKLPSKLVIEASDYLIDRDLIQAQAWIEKVDARKVSPLSLLSIKIKLTERLGRLDELYKLITDMQIYLFENKIPSKIESIQTLISKYFKDDFKIKLQALALSIQRNDFVACEFLVQELILSCYEKTSVKGILEKFTSLISILKLDDTKSPLILYRNFLEISITGLSSPGDFKKAAELVIFFDQYEFQVLLLNLIHQHGLNDLTVEFSKIVKTNVDYDFVYLDKHFPHLKQYFVRLPKTSKPIPEFVGPDLGLIYPEIKLHKNTESVEAFDYEQEQKLIQLFKFQEMKSSELSEVAISFLQSSFPRVALKAIEMAQESALTDKEKLKCFYLKLMCLIELQDYRKAIDTSIEALKLSTTSDEVLSFLYCQAEAYAQLGNTKEARSLYKKISSIDPSYRLTKERLEKLNAI